MDESPFFKEIKSDQRYQDILNTMKLVWQEEHEKVRAWLEEEEMLL
jgi:hypothetical protein